MSLLAGKVCVITGGAGSVGLASARRFVAEGAKVLLVDLREGDLKRAVDALKSDMVATYAGDVADAATVRGYFDAATKAWGGVDVLFSNAGNPGHIASLADYDEDAFDFTYRVHARGAFLACKYGASQIRDGGSIIIMSSLAGVRGGGGQNIAYVAAKHAQIGIMRAAARALAGRGVRVNTINPGPIDNVFQTGIENEMSALSGVNITAELDKQIPLKRHGRPDEIASIALYLASNMSSYVTGAIHMADGGLMS